MSKSVVSTNIITKPYYKYKKEAFESLSSLIYSIFSSSGRLAGYGTTSISSSKDLTFDESFSRNIEGLNVSTPSGYTIARVIFGSRGNSYISFLSDYVEVPKDILSLAESDVYKIKGYIMLLVRTTNSVDVPKYERYLYASNSQTSITGYNKDRSHKMITWRDNKEYLRPIDYLSRVKV